MPKQVLIAIGLGDTQTEKDTSTCLANNPSSKKLRPKRPTPEIQPGLDSFIDCPRQVIVNVFGGKPQDRN